MNASGTLPYSVVSAPPSPFAALLLRVLSNKKKFPTQKALAEFIRVTSQTVSRVKTRGGHFNAEGCIRLAQADNSSASEALRLAGKGDYADLLETMYGRSNLTPALKELISLWTRVNDETRETVLALLRLTARQLERRRRPPAVPPRATARTTRRSPKR